MEPFTVTVLFVVGSLVVIIGLISIYLNGGDW